MSVNRIDISLRLLSYLLLLTLLFCGCSSDYTIMTREIEVDRVVEVPVYIEVEIAAMAGELWVDSFTQSTAANGIDILWVIDTSGSMSDDTPHLLSGITAMMAALPSSGWRLAMIPMTPNAAVNVQQFPLVPGDNLQDVEVMHGNMPTGGGEAGFDAVYAYLVENPYSHTWTRFDAALLVVFVSDEEEQSNNIFQDLEEFITWYAGHRVGVHITSIVHLPSDESQCNPSGTSVGQRYIDAAGHFEGVVIDICSEDWSAGVAAASGLIEPYDQWPLQYQPLAGTIRVFIDGQLSQDWAHDVMTNTVHFTVLPPAAALVEVGYIIDPAS